MTEGQNRTVATTVAALILTVVFLCPWRVESSGDLRWSPIYQPPLSYVRTYNPDYGQEGGSRIESEDAHIAIEVLLLQVLAVGAAGALLYRISSNDEDDERPNSDLGIGGTYTH